MDIKIEKVIPLQEYANLFTHLEMKRTSTKHLDSALSLCHKKSAQEYEDEVELWKTYGGS